MSQSLNVSDKHLLICQLMFHNVIFVSVRILAVVNYNLSNHLHQQHNNQMRLGSCHHDYVLQAVRCM